MEKNSSGLYDAADKNGIDRRISEAMDSKLPEPIAGRASQAAAKGETRLDSDKRAEPGPVLDPHHVTARDAAKEAVARLMKGISNGDGASIIAGAIALAAAVVAGMRELRMVKWAINVDLNRHFLARLADMPINKRFRQEFAKVKQPVEILHPKIGAHELKLLDQEYPRIDEDVRRALSEKRHIAADLFENTLRKNLETLTFAGDPANQADRFAIEAREYNFCNESGWHFEFRFPFLIRRTIDSQEFREAKAFEAERYEEIAGKLRTARKQNRPS